MNFITFRRYYLDEILLKTNFYGKILDVGGKKDNKRGRFRPPLESVDSWEYLNIDISTNPDYCCSADNIPVKDEVFDMLLLNEVLEHLKNPEEVLRECYRVLKKDGKLVITIPFMYAIHADPYDFQRWTDVKIKMELENIGFKDKDINIQSMGSLFAVIYDLIYVSLNSASKNSQSIRNRFGRRFILPAIAKLFIFLDKKYMYKSKIITTGYYVEIKK